MYRRIALILFVLVVSFSAAIAQPVLRAQYPIMNSASSRAAGLPGSGIAQGSIFSIYGTGLGPDSPATPYTFPLPTTLGGTSATITVGSVSTQAIVLFTYNYQVNAILPSATPIGDGTLTLTYNGQTSASAPIQVVGSAFGIYTFGSYSYGQAVSTFPDYSLNTIIKTFHPGDTAILWGTGLGPISGSDAAAPPTGNLPGSITVHVGDKTAAVSYQGRSGCCSGVDQIVYQIPAGVQGCHVPVAVEAGGAVSNITTIAVSTSGQTCTDSEMGQALVDKLASGQPVNFGYARLESVVVPVAAGAASRPDTASIIFNRHTPQTAAMAQYGVSSGYCTAVDCSYINCPASGFSMLDWRSAQLDAGSSVTLEGQGRTIPVPAQQYPIGFYTASLNFNGNRYLWSTFPYTLSGAGGANVGSFSAIDTTSIPAVQLSDLHFSQAVPMSSDFTVKWTGGDATLQNGNVTISGFSTSTDFSKWGVFQCTAPMAAHQFTIPKWVLSFLPPSGTQYAGQGGSLPFPIGWIYVGQYNKPVEFTASGLDRGIITDIFYNGMPVYFQ